MTTRSWSASHAPCARTPPTASARSEMTARLLYVSHFARSRRTTPRTALANFVTRADCCPTPAGIQAQTRAARGQREYVRDKACRARHAPAVPVRHSGERAGGRPEDDGDHPSQQKRAGPQVSHKEAETARSARARRGSSASIPTSETPARARPRISNCDGEVAAEAASQHGHLCERGRLSDRRSLHSARDG